MEIARIIWIDTCYRFCCAFYKDKQESKVDASARRWNEAMWPWLQKGAPYARLPRLTSWTIYYLLVPVWYCRGYRW